MGNTIWIEAQGRSAKKTHNDLSILHALDKQLDVLAEKLGVTKLTDFYDYQSLIDDFDDDFDDEGDADGGDDEDEEDSEPSWFDSAKGLETVKTLRDQLAKDFDALKWKPDKSTQHYPQRLLEELEFCESVLEKAVAKRKQFRLLIVS